MTQPYTPRIPSDPNADPNRTADELDLQATTAGQADESSANRDRITALGRCACVVYLHASLSAGAPSTLATAGARITSVGTTVAIALEPDVETPYTVRVDDEASASDLVYRVDSRLSGSLIVRATDLAGAAVDLSTGDRAFSLSIHRLLPKTF